MVIPGSFHALTSSSVRVKIVDIGANPIDGQPPYATLLRGGHADIIGFEPNPTALAKLNEQKGPTETYLPNAIGDGKRHTLHMCASQGMTSLLTPNPDVLNLFHGFPRWGQVMSTEELDTTRLDDIPETEGIDLVKIDIQGGELMAFQNATKRLADALVIQTEVEFLPLYVDQPLFGDVDVFLRSQGYVFHRFFPTVSRTIQPMLVQNNIYAGLSQTVWADAIFVRDFTKLSRLSPRQLLAMAAILHDCYQSYDLVLHVLLEHDRRTGEAVAPAYMTNLTAQAAAAPAAS
jgi:FkbM family methyltransferase